VTKPIHIVLAHGRAADLEIAATASRLWTDALIQGLQRVGSEYADRVQVDYAFFGGLWRRDAGRAMPQYKDADGKPFTVALTPTPHVVPGKPGIVERGLGDIGRFAAKIAPDAAMEGLLSKAIPDVFDYLDDQERRDAANAIVAKACTDAGARVLVGFSMGTIVGYDVLRTAPAGFPVKAFVTCGSPIALEPIHKRLVPGGPTPFPPVIDLWLNIWNDDDVATGIHGEELAALFPGGTIQDAEAFGRAPSPTNIFAAHNAIDYLSSLAAGLAIHVALGATEGD
jgi:hypothetical protein